MKKFKIQFSGWILIVCGLCMAGLLYAALDAPEIDGETRNKIQDYVTAQIAAIPSGGGTGNASTNNLTLQVFGTTNQFKYASFQRVSITTNGVYRDPFNSAGILFEIDCVNNNDGMNLNTYALGSKTVGYSIGDDSSTAWTQYMLRDGAATIRGSGAITASPGGGQPFTSSGKTVLGANGTSILDIPATSFVFSSPALVPGTSLVTNITFTAATVGSVLTVGVDKWQTGLRINAVCTNAGTATIEFVNEQLIGNITPAASTTYRVRAIDD